MISSLLPDVLYSELKLAPFLPPLPKNDSDVIDEKLRRFLKPPVPLSLLKLIRLIF